MPGYFRLHFSLSKMNHKALAFLLFSFTSVMLILLAIATPLTSLLLILLLFLMQMFWRLGKALR